MGWTCGECKEDNVWVKACGDLVVEDVMLSLGEEFVVDVSFSYMLK